MSLGVVIAFIVGLILGLMIAWYYWQRQIKEREAEIQGIQATLREKERSLYSLETRLQERDASIKQLQGQVKQDEDSIVALTAQIDKKNRVVSLLEEAVSEREAKIEGWKSRAEQARAKALATEMKAALERRELAAQQIESIPSRTAEVQVSAKSDNLKRIEGIGPKISSVLKGSGIMSFEQLAAADVGHLEQILKEAGMTLADPTTWPEQAGLAAVSDWKALEALQDELNGGRRV
jgi:predicted flap endonuclease-1-like 5' DNA nuclease